MWFTEKNSRYRAHGISDTAFLTRHCTLLAQKGMSSMETYLLDQGASLYGPSGLYCECSSVTETPTIAGSHGTFLGEYRFGTHDWFPSWLPLHHAVCDGHSSPISLDSPA
jgi:hypothetical protein